MENSLQKHLQYCNIWSLYARWQKYMSDDDNKKYNYFVDIWDSALDTGEYMAGDQDYVWQLGDMAFLFPGGENDDIRSYYNICFLHTILLVKGDKSMEKWII